jgi:hypothetical protein
VQRAEGEAAFTSGANGTVGAVLGLFRKAVREEAAPVARQLAEVRGLTNGTIRRLERIEATLDAEREARVEDLAVLVELVTAGWKTVEERLARIEATVGAERGTVYRLEEAS